jgi:ribosomal protein L20
MNGMSYSKLDGWPEKSRSRIDRKVLANIAILDPSALFPKV